MIKNKKKQSIIKLDLCKVKIKKCYSKVEDNEIHIWKKKGK